MSDIKLNVATAIFITGFAGIVGFTTGAIKPFFISISVTAAFALMFIAVFTRK